MLKKRAEEINSLMEKTVDELSNAREGISGNVRIGCGETAGMQIIARAISEIRKDFSAVTLPFALDIWGVLMRKDSPLAAQDKICAADLDGLPLIISQQALNKNELENWFGKKSDELNIVATYTLIYNASLMAEEGIGYVLTLDKLLNLDENSNLTFKPLSPPNIFRNFFIWKKNQLFSNAASLLHEKITALSDYRR